MVAIVRSRRGMQADRFPCATDTNLVLDVDDDQELRTYLEMVLDEEGFSVLTAPNGAAALDLIGQYRPAAIILDIQMPVMERRPYVPPSAT